MPATNRELDLVLRSREHYLYSTHITTRWADNDVYGHINNAHYYQYFDTVVNEYLIEHAGLDFQHDDIVAYVVASSCQYRSPMSHPVIIEACMRVNRLGKSSVEYGVALFAGAQSKAAAFGTFTHVYVDRAGNSSSASGQGSATAIPAVARLALQKLCKT